MNFLACDGSWSVASGSIACNGTLITITSEEIAEEINPGLTLEESDMLIDASIALFATVFFFLILRKAA